MRAVRGSGTSLERRLWAMMAGMRLSGWRRNAPEVVGKPDAAFCEERVAVFVDGCFWHGCPHCKRPMPENNAEYWLGKIKRNVDRDNRVNCDLFEQGWAVIRIWEHEMKEVVTRKGVASRLRSALERVRCECSVTD